jgi:hypothetical protein
MKAVAIAALSAYRAKLEAKAAHEVFVAATIEFGPCHGDELKKLACYYDEELARKDWCDACTSRQPYHERKIAAARKSGVAMRRLWQLCSKAI